MLCGQSVCDVAAGNLSISGGGNDITICAGDGISDAFDVTLIDNEGTSGWIITDANNQILALPAGPPFDLDGAGAGLCIIYHISSMGEVNGLSVGADITNLTGCFELSNCINVTRNDPEEEVSLAGHLNFVLVME